MKNIILLTLSVVVVSCTSLRRFPKEQYYSYLYYFTDEHKSDTLFIHLKNPVMCPLRVQLKDDTINKQLSKLFGNVFLRANQDTILKIYYPNYNKNPRIYYRVKYGNPDKEIIKNKIALPFHKGKTYKIIQAYNGKFSHNGIRNRYAIDFSLKIGDTITSSDYGYVVGVIEDYKDYGTGKKWLHNDKSNYITIYSPHSGLFIQYVHLDHKGALVELGDYVEKGQPIGICGMTGYTNIEHLHFNVLYPNNKNELISTDIEFENGIKGAALKRGDYIKRQ